MEHLRKAPTHCKYPKWALDRVEKRLTKPTREVSNGADSQGTAGAQTTANEVKTKDHIVISYTQGLCKSIKKICSRYGIQTHFKGNSTIKNLMVSPKDKDPMANKSGAIYWFQCGNLTCDDEYIGERAPQHFHCCHYHNVDHPLILPVCCTFDCFVLKLFLHLYISYKCSRSLYEAFQMKEVMLGSYLHP